MAEKTTNQQCHYAMIKIERFFCKKNALYP